VKIGSTIDQIMGLIDSFGADKFAIGVMEEHDHDTGDQRLSAIKKKQDIRDLIEAYAQQEAERGVL